LRVLITGGSGFIGTNLVEAFASRGDPILNLDIAAPRNPAHHHHWRRCDIRDEAALGAEVRNFAPEAIIHMAARTDLDGHAISDYTANTTGVRNLVEIVTQQPSLRRLVFASSRLVCRIGYQPRHQSDYCPTTAYGESKVEGERIARSACDRLPCPWIIVRPTSIWGPWFDVPYKTFFMSIARGRYVHPGKERILKSFGFVGNTAHQVQRLVDEPLRDLAGTTIYLADHPPIDVGLMAEAIQRQLAARSIRTLPVGMLRVAAAGGDLLKALGWPNPPLTSFRLDNLMTPMVHDLGPVERVAGKLPYSMEEGVAITVAWLRARGEVA
jgi:nucleoside-diphosphate-sugar epimerase